MHNSLKKIPFSSASALTDIGIIVCTLFVLCESYQAFEKERNIFAAINFSIIGGFGAL